MSVHPVRKRGKVRWAVLAALVVVGVVVIVWALWGWGRFVGYGTAFGGGGGEDELLADGILDPIDWSEFSIDAVRDKETSEPVDIDGRSGHLSRAWYTNGNMEYEETWLDGWRKHGRETWWFGNGQKFREYHWKEGYMHGRSTIWYPNGQMARDAGYDRYRLQGTHRTWFRDGQESTRVEFRDGLREGEFLAWHPNGKMWCRAVFSGDRLHGPLAIWDAEGRVVRRVDYRDGVLATEIPEGRPAPPDYQGRLGSSDFGFIVAQGSYWHGFNVVKVSAAGRCECRYFFTAEQVSTVGDQVVGPRPGDIYLTQVWRKAEFRLSDEEQRLLRDALVAADVFSLWDRYTDPNIADGTQWVIRLKAGGQEKVIRCSNSFPEPLRKLSRVLRQQIMVPHKMDLMTASRIEADPNFPEDEGWLADTPR